ncbi:hypothetical protein SELR_pSRC500310 (plasmid) [Selenomonas ruminantium subsp. lactilytica TAM6421]|uniref:Uncharacterized protein n=1 Tax=Selenomonas ruminantium subsp. lactilytica (strain NBRC 103574 / TAM6421) TaxID=927704 RepID=I0GWR8_SELRL|nr:hypothetical protein SELR_pSRC500310 [Selenomonas ruminantium subsp. lactilytica TAM6421]
MGMGERQVTLAFMKYELQQRQEEYEKQQREAQQ